MNIETLKLYVSKLPSYTEFYHDLCKNELSLSKTLQSLNSILPLNKNLTKLAQMGMLLKLNYELFYDSHYYDSFIYSMNVNQYINDLTKIQRRIKERKINKREFKSKSSNSMKGLYYLPHIENDSVVKNSISLKSNLIITGPNASGKTTLLKSLLINLIVSQQWGYGCFESCKIPVYDNFYSYLNIPDTSNRDSLFQAESRRCKEIFVDIYDHKKERSFCIFDEIYSGTNPTDAVLCATAYLKAMNSMKHKCDFVLTTHYLQLCKDLDDEESIHNMKMKTIVKERKLQYTYSVVDGISDINGGKQVLLDLEYPKFILDFV